MKKLLLTTIPFEGFYETLSDERVDEALGISENNHEYWNEENTQRPEETKTNGFATWKIPAETDAEYSDRREAYFNELRDNADYYAMRKEYCKMYVEEFSKDNKITLEFESLSSPREYNFSTDRIFCFISQDEVARLLKEVDRKQFAEYIKENFTSYDGFSSSYSEYIDDWNLEDVESLDHNEVGALIECVTAKHIEEANGLCLYINNLMEYFYR